MKAVILAGGLGTRLRPQTNKLPKPMIPVLGKPILWWLINNLAKHKINEIYFTLFYLPWVIKNYLGNGSYFGIKANFIIEKKPLGSAGGLKFLEGKVKSSFLVLNGDVINLMNFHKLIKFHQKKAGIATLVVHSTDHSYDSDLVEINENQQVKRIFKPQKTDKFVNLANAGCFVFEPQVLKFIPKNSFFSLEKDLIPYLLSANLPVFAYKTSEYLKDAGTSKRLKHIKNDLKENNIAL